MMKKIYLIIMFSILFQISNAQKQNDVKVFFKNYIENPTKSNFENAMPNLFDCKKVLTEEAATKYFKNLISVLDEWRNEYISSKNLVQSIEISEFTKADLISKNGNYHGGGGMYNIANDLKENIIIYSIAYKNNEGHRISNLFVFNNGTKYVFLPKPWIFIKK
jgi:hypothetical protein